MYNIYCAPMEGITGYIFRNVHHRMFPGIAKYFTPFISVTGKLTFRGREQRDAAPENNSGTPVVPQVLTNKSDQLLYFAEYMGQSGYREINLNLGCPSPTVVTRKKGSGMISDTVLLREFFAEYFKQAAPESPALSVKTRIGLDFTSEWEDLISIYNDYPISELIIHPRTGREMYRGRVHLDVFSDCLSASTHPVCYNGDVQNASDIKKIQEMFPDINAIMIGRGLIADPALAREDEGGETLKPDELKEFHDQLLSGYLEQMNEEKNALFRMFELWDYFGANYEDAERSIRKLKKSRNLGEYKINADRIFSGGGGTWKHRI